MPKDKRLRKIFQSFMKNPADRGTLASWARRVAMSERSLARLMVAETGMSFGRWRQLGDIRVFSAVEEQPEPRVTVAAMGLKRHNELWIGKERIEL
jgi:methylphosphotriester-DNA--protein-cysteine methyltransferase